ncbi:MAG: C69 family dipeptidase [Clostridiales bacterium]|nr:C69 family dipeptidase [Clostridiales bacterium]
MNKKTMLLVASFAILLTLLFIGIASANAQAADWLSPPSFINSLDNLLSLDVIEEQGKGCSAFAAGKDATAASAASGGKAGYTINAYTCDGTNDYRLVIHEARPLLKDGTDVYVINYRGVSGNQHTINANIPVPDFVLEKKDYTNKWFDVEVPVANEKQVFFNENTDSSWSGLSNISSNTGLTDWHTLLGITLEWADTASEAVDIMGYLIETYGLRGSAESFMVSDPDEVWIFEIPGNSKMWLAQRVPDNAVAFHANKLRLQQIDLDDPANFRYAKDANGYPEVISYAAGRAITDTAHPLRVAGETHYYYEPARDGDFSFEKVYSQQSSRTSTGNIHREYIAYKLLCPSVNWDPAAIDYPVYVVPEIAVTPEWVMDVLWKNAYESETFALNQGYAAGPFKTIDRQSGMGTFERPIATHTQTYTTVSVARDWLPHEFGLMWYTNNHSRTGLYVPIYVSTKRADMPDSWWNFPAEFGTEANPLLYQFKYDPNSTWWQFQMLKTFCNLRYKDMLAEIRSGRTVNTSGITPTVVNYSVKGWDEIERADRNNLNTVEGQALALSGQARINFLSAYSGERCENADTAVRDMMAHLIRYFRNAGGNTAAPALTANYVRPGGPLWSSLWANETTAGRVAGSSLQPTYNDAGVDNLGYYFYVTFDPDEGAFALPDNYPNPAAIKRDGTYVKRVGMYNHGVALPPAPQREGYTFSGWFDSKSGGAEYKGKTDLSGNLYLYAHWTAASDMINYQSELLEEITEYSEVLELAFPDEWEVLTDVDKDWVIIIDEDELSIDDDEKACSAFAAGKDATGVSAAAGGRDGYTVNAYTCDGSSNDLRLTIREPRPLVKGESFYHINYMGTAGNAHNIFTDIPVPDFVIDGFGSSPAKTQTNKWFKTEVPIANEKQVYFNENTDGSQSALSNSTSARCFTDWHTLLGITLEWADTAYDAVSVMGYLIENYGLRGSAESFVVSDPNECWVFEIPGNSTMWIAARIPDDGAVYRANRLRIQDIDFDDPDNFRYSVDAQGRCTLVTRATSVMRSGSTPYYSPDLNGPFNFAKIYSTGHSTSSNVDREYPAMNLLCPSVNWRLYCISFPLWVIPEVAVTPEWVMDTLWKCANEGTLLDRTIGYQHGPFKSPDRQSGYGSGPYHISTDTQAYTSVGVGRNWVPHELGMTWFGWSSSRTSLYVPLYVCTKLSDMPKSWYDLKGFGTEEDPILYQWKYDENSTFWHFQYLKSLCNVRYSDMMNDVRNGFSSTTYSVKGFSTIEAEDRAAVAVMDTAALALNGQARIDYLSAYSGERAANADKAARDMVAHLITRFRNGSPSVASGFNNLTVYGGAASAANPTWSSLYAAENPANYFTLRNEGYVKNTLGYYYDVTFNPNGGAFSSTLNNIYAINDGLLTKTVGGVANKNFNIGVGLPPTPLREGYRFDGWFDALNGGREYLAHTPITADTTLFAHWTKYNFKVWLEAAPGELKEGGTLKVDVLLLGDLNYTMLAADIVYDNELLEYDGYDYLRGWVASVSAVAPNKATVRSMPSMNMVTGEDCSKPTVVATLKFKIKEGFELENIETALDFATLTVSPAGTVKAFLVEPSKPLTVTLYQ